MTKFRGNTFKCTDGNFRKGQKLSNQEPNQERFHEHYLQVDPNGICDWETTIIDKAET